MKHIDFLNSPRIDQVGIEDRIARITARSIKKESKMQGLLMALNMIDLTTLEGADTDEKVKQLCFKAHHLHDELPGLPTTAAVCVYPNFVKLAVNELKGTGVKIASVATAFPSGQSSAEIKLLDTKIAVDSGADEVDMVISRGKFHSGEYNFVFDEIAMIKEACGKNVRLKVILETGEITEVASDEACIAQNDGCVVNVIDFPLFCPSFTSHPPPHTFSFFLLRFLGKLNFFLS